MTTTDGTTRADELLVRWRRRRLLLRAAWFCALACVLAASLTPSDSAAKRAMDDLPVSDKVGHFGAYFLLALLPALTETRRSAALHAAGIVALGFLLEFWQSRFAGREFDAGDVTANVAGLLIALVLVEAEPRLRLIQPKGA